MSDKEKLELVLAALQIIVVTTSDSLTAEYCVTILEEVEGGVSLEMLKKFYDRDLN